MNDERDDIICPYCGHCQADRERCESCRGLFEPLSRQATQNAMGPWFIRDESQPFRPGCSYETISRLAARGRISDASIIRGPTTQQFWLRAQRTPGIAHLLGVCHACSERVLPTDVCCEFCGAPFTVDDDRQTLGLAPMRDIETMARQAASAPRAAPAGAAAPAPGSLASVGYDRLRAAVEAQEARAAQASTEDQGDEDATGRRQPQRRRAKKTQPLTPGQLMVEKIRRERRMLLLQSAVASGVIALIAAVLIWILAWAGAISLPFNLPGLEPTGDTGEGGAAAAAADPGDARSDTAEPADGEEQADAAQDNSPPDQP